jgi:hypothetical protein
MINFISSVRNLIAYFPIIWKDRDFDFSFYTRLQLFKLKRMYKVLNQKHSNVEWKKSVQALRLCILILERQKDDWYYDMISKRSSDPDDSLEIYYSIKDRDWKMYNDLMYTYHNFWWD